MINCREVEKQFQHLDEDRLNILLSLSLAPFFSIFDLN